MALSMHTVLFWQEQARRTGHLPLLQHHIRTMTSLAVESPGLPYLELVVSFVLLVNVLHTYLDVRQLKAIKLPNPPAQLQGQGISWQLDTAALQRDIRNPLQPNRYLVDPPSVLSGVDRPCRLDSVVVALQVCSAKTCTCKARPTPSTNGGLGSTMASTP
eukprot:GHUV01028459.1.p1 GENE.GHUV01028459.1~~GHUV01028459.1.p1  ORF type:complete len:160 (+),score=19.31 GHUV01028459.1:66-545(+)